MPVEGLPDRFGVLSPRCGEACFQYIRTAVELAQSGQAAGIVTAPINKEALNAAGHHYDGHTGLLAHLTGRRHRGCCSRPSGSTSSMSRPTSRCEPPSSGRRRSGCLKRSASGSAICGAWASRRRGSRSPGSTRIAARTGCSDARTTTTSRPPSRPPGRKGSTSSGPISADTVYHRAYQGAFDLVVAQYHDQGHIPIKLVAFDSAVNVSLGLPIDRSSVDHGTAFDIAGTGRANHVNMLSALDYARRLAMSKAAPSR